MKNILIKISIASTLILTSSFGLGQSVIENPSERVINLPIRVDENGQWKLKLPTGPSKRPPRVIASCQLENLSIQVIKENKQRKSEIREIKNGQESTRVIPFVVVQKVTKDMLGQYAAAVVIAQELGITEVDYIKIMLVDPQLKLEDTKALAFFYDSDDDVIERTLITGNQWVRCLEE